MVGAGAAGTSIGNGTKAFQIMENHQEMMESPLAIMDVLAAVMEDDLKWLLCHSWDLSLLHLHPP